MAPEVDQVESIGLDERRGRGRDEDLASMACAGDAAGAMDVLPDVALVGEERRPGVDPAMRTWSRPAASAAWASEAASSACWSVSNTKKKESPCVSTSTPPWRANAPRTAARWSANDSAYRSWPRSSRSAVGPRDVGEDEGHRASRKVAPHRRHDACAIGAIPVSLGGRTSQPSSIVVTDDVDEARVYFLSKYEARRPRLAVQQV
jgi:hypothetical protein